MIGPVSETGKTMLSSLQGAMSKGMPVDQAITYVKSMAQQGVAPLVDLYALLKQFERMKQPPAQAPQGGNLKEQLNSLESSIVNRQQGLGGMQPGAMPPTPQMYTPPQGGPPPQGLASLDAGAMENPAFAGGGIVAFAQGGQPEAPRSFTPELYTLPKSREELARKAMAEEEALKTPEGRAAFLAKRDAEMKEAGLGEYAKSLKMRDEMAEEAAKRAEILPGEEAALNEESFWADVAGSDEPDFVSAMAKSKAKAVERKRASRERVQAAKEKAAEERVLRQEAREALKRGDMDEHKRLIAAAETLKNTTVNNYVTVLEADRAREETAKNARELARIQTDTPLKRAQETLRTTPMYLPNGEPNPAYGEAARVVSDLNAGRGGAANRSQIGYYRDIYTKASTTLRKAQEAYAAYGTAETKAALQAAQAAEAKARQDYERASLGPSFDAMGGDAGSDELPPGFNLDQ
jgi:hypothetical protein